MQFKKIREPLLIISGVVLALLAIWFCFAMILFLGRVLNSSLSFEQRPIRPGEFDIEGFEKLNLMQEQRVGTNSKPVTQNKATTTTPATSTIPKR